MKTVSPRRTKGFTLVELLVVIAISATLASLAFLGSRSAMNAAKATKVGNNMKNIHVALVSLRDEGVDTGNHNPGSFPPASGSMDDEQGTEFLWWDLCAEEMGVAKLRGNTYEWIEAHSETVFQNPLSKHKLGGNRKQWTSLSNSTSDSHGGFAYNGALGDDAGGGGETEGAFVVRDTQIENATNTIWFGESDDDSERAGWIFDDMSSAPQGSYKNQVNVCMVDGSIRVYSNVLLKRAGVFEFLTTVKDKNFDNAP